LFGIEIVPNTTPDVMIEFSRACEKYGFDNIWVADHFNNRNVYCALETIALNTSRIKIGTGVANPYHTHPAIIASSIATINEISRGRAILGIGAGDESTLQKIGLKRVKPLKYMEESIAIIRNLLAGKKVDFEGEFFHIAGAKLDFNPGRIPIYIGAQGPKMLQLAGKLGDGVLINASHPKNVSLSIHQIKKGIRGRTIEKEPIVCISTCLSIDRDPTIAREVAKTVVGFITAGSSDIVLKDHGIKIKEAKDLKKFIIEEDWTSLKNAVTEQMISSFAIAGDVDEVREKIIELIELGVDQIIVGSPFGSDKLLALKLLKEISSSFRQ
jgi:5,10-methylenetetrahydromethanopterin reductase